jgi:Conserved hypothetical protein (DUF2461)
MDHVTEPVYRVAEQEWKDFVDAFTDALVEVDPQVPHLPPKDVIHRIYRDVSWPARLGLVAYLGLIALCRFGSVMIKRRINEASQGRFRGVEGKVSLPSVSPPFRSALSIFR